MKISELGVVERAGLAPKLESQEEGTTSMRRKRFRFIFYLQCRLSKNLGGRERRGKSRPLMTPSVCLHIFSSML